jgi:carboxypeptidase Q
MVSRVIGIAAAVTVLALGPLGAGRAGAQGAPALDSLVRGDPSGDAVVQRIYDEGMHHSQTASLAQVLMDSIGPRLTGSAANRAANDWLVRTYSAWGIPAHNEQYGTWRDWTRGPSEIQLVTPRRRMLEATELPWSPSTPPGGADGDAVMLPPVSEAGDSAGFARWLATVKGKFVMLSVPQPSCRPDTNWTQWASPRSTAAARAARDSITADWEKRIGVALGNGPGTDFAPRFAAAGAIGLLTNMWSEGWGVDKIMSGGPVGATTTLPIFDVSCEDYSLLARLAAHGQHPRVHALAEGHLAPHESPVFNTIARLDGSEHPNQYVMLSAHLDSWDAGSGATDNGTGTIVMLEAMRLLKQAYPHPKRTILVGHWSGEEQGEVGSTSFTNDHPEVLAGLQVLFNQDNGTGNIDTVDTYGFLDAPAAFARWMARMPADMTAGITIDEPGYSKKEDSDSDAFACLNAPAFFLTSADWGYTDYTWHTNRDTYDKISFDEVKRNATLIALLAYEASEDPAQMSRVRRVPPADPSTGQPIPPFQCNRLRRSWASAR